MPWWGIAAWAPTPRISTSKKEADAISVPARPPILPEGSFGQMWKPNIRSIPSRTPCSIIFRAPAPPSSAGWNTSFTVPRSEASRSFRSAAAPRSIVVCASCPQACIFPSTLLLKGTSVSSWMGRASMSARRPTVGPSPRPSFATVPVPATTS